MAFCDVATAQASNDLTTAAQRIIGNPAFSEHSRACPVDFFATLSSSPTQDIPDCADAPLTCLATCGTGDSGACFHLGEALFAAGDDPVFGLAPTLLAYERSCALGQVAGCTARAAYFLAPTGGALPGRTQAETFACGVRTFAFTCERRHAWGCTMLGVQYQYGLGVPPDAAKARMLFDKACALWPDGDACLRP